MPTSGLTISKAVILMLLIGILTLTPCSAERPSPSNVQKFCAIPGDTLVIDGVSVRYNGYFMDSTCYLVHILSVPYGVYSMVQIYVRDGKPVRLTDKLVVLIKQEDDCLLITKMHK